MQAFYHSATGAYNFGSRLYYPGEGSIRADFEEAIPITYIMAGEWLYHSERSAFCA